MKKSARRDSAGTTPLVGRPRREGERIALVTGFEPFGGERVNPSREIALALDGQTIAAHRIVGAVLPTEFDKSLAALRALLRRHRPALVLALGQAGGRAEISLERVAINLIDARIKDNAGVQPIDRRVIRGAPNAYFTKLPVKAMLARLREAGIAAALSQSAGTFVCNQVFFGLAHALARNARARGGFIHVPYLPEQAALAGGAPGMPLATMIEAIRLCVLAAARARKDASYAAGSTH